MNQMQNTGKPVQAVILAGGRGTRLAPLTDLTPKPMIPFNGRPFLQYLLEYLKDQGFQKVLLLLGYLPDQITQYFGDGSKFGLQIQYSITDVENETGPRLYAARQLLDPYFLLMYCDNYCALDLVEMWEHFCKKATLAQITVYGNRDHFTRDNLRLVDGMVVQYDKTRTAANLSGVDIGFAYLKSEVLDLLPQGNLNFEKEVYPWLVDRQQMAGYLTDQRYYSVGNIERLPMTEKFLKREPVIFLDRDGVINQKAGPGEYILKPEDFHWIEGSKEALALLHQNGYRIVIISNQAGIGRGLMTEADLQRIHDKLQSDCHGVITAIYYCPHGWNDNCECRKPKPGMLLRAQREHCIDLTRTYFIGDDERDIAAGKSAGCHTYLFKKGESLLRVLQDLRLLDL